MKPILTYEVSGEELKSMGCGVIVEMWHKKDSGRFKRAWDAEKFTLEEVVLAKKFYDLAYNWEFRRGYPLTFQFKSMESMRFLQRLCNFFGTL